MRLGHAVELLPAHDVRSYVPRNKTDRADAAGLLEAARCEWIRRWRNWLDHGHGFERVGGRFRSLPSGRHFASSLGVTPREHSSGSTHRLGRVTKRGDVYLRMLLIHGARAVLRNAKLPQKKQQPLDRTRAWALALSGRIGHNKAAVALANKQARRLWAAEHHRVNFDPDHVSVHGTPASTN